MDAGWQAEDAMVVTGPLECGHHDQLIHPDPNPHTGLCGVAFSPDAPSSQPPPKTKRPGLELPYRASSGRVYEVSELENFLKSNRATGYPHPNMQAAGNYVVLLKTMGCNEDEAKLTTSASSGPIARVFMVML